MSDLPQNPKIFDPTAKEVTLDSIADDIVEIKDQIQYLMRRRILQTDLVPDVVKTRAMGEANRYIFSGLEADRPTDNKFDNSTTVYFATDTKKLWIWTGAAWVSTTLA